MTEQISIPFSWDDLCDIIHYAEWKVEEVDEAGCELEHPNIREVLKRLKYIQSRMRYSPTEEAQRIIDQEMIAESLPYEKAAKDFYNSQE